jgi:N,N'-diacetyllegionaminate synthase
MVFNKKLTIKNKIISTDSATFIIAEAGVNHGGDVNVAKQLIDVAVQAGADAVKFQAFKASNLILENVEKAPYQKGTTKASESQYEMLSSLELSDSQNLELKSYCDQNNIIFITTPFDEASFDSIQFLDLPAYKVSSTDLTNLMFLKKIANKGKPIFLSTGMSYMTEIELALKTIHKYNKDVILLHCTANYPIQDDEVNLNVLNSFKDNFDILIGYSDHSVGVGAAPYAIPMGARVVEKHFTLDKSLEGPDHLASLTPKELKEFVTKVKTVDSYMGSHIKQPNLSELETRKSLQKSFVAIRKIKKDEKFSEQNVIAKRTGGIGISAIYVNEVLGKKAKKDFSINDVIEL